VQPSVALGVGVWFVARVDDRSAARRRTADPFPDVLRPLRHGERCPARRLQYLARSGEDLATDEERNQHLCVVRHVVGTTGQEVFVTAVAVACRVGVVLEEIDGATNTFLFQPLLSRLQQALEDAFARLVVYDQVVQAVAFRCCVLWVRADIEIQPRTVLQKHVAAASPADDSSKQVTGDFVGAQPALTAQGAGDAVLVLESKNAPLHARTVAEGGGFMPRDT